MRLALIDGTGSKMMLAEPWARWSSRVTTAFETEASTSETRALPANVSGPSTPGSRPAGTASKVCSTRRRLGMLTSSPSMLAPAKKPSPAVSRKLLNRSPCAPTAAAVFRARRLSTPSAASEPLKLVCSRVTPNSSGSEGSPSTCPAGVPVSQRLRLGSLKLIGSRLSKVTRPDGERMACTGTLSRVSPTCATICGADSNPASRSKVSRASKAGSSRGATGSTTPIRVRTSLRSGPLALIRQPRKAGSPVDRSRSPTRLAVASANPSVPSTATACERRKRSRLATCPSKRSGVPCQTARALRVRGLARLSSAASTLISLSSSRVSPAASATCSRLRSSTTPSSRSAPGKAAPLASALVAAAAKFGIPAIPPSGSSCRLTSAPLSRIRVTVTSPRSRSRVLSDSAAPSARASGGRAGSVASMTKSPRSNLTSGTAASRMEPLSCTDRPVASSTAASIRSAKRSTGNSGKASTAPTASTTSSSTRNAKSDSKRPMVRTLRSR